MVKEKKDAGSGAFKRAMKKNNSSDDFDGCGITPLISPNDSLRAACKRHDERYLFFGPGKRARERASVDKEFLLDMKRIIRSSGKWWLYPKAYLYYGIARVFGGIFYD